MSHLEDLLVEYYEWRGYIVKCGVLVGKRDRGGWEMELDVVALDTKTSQLLHIEPSLDAHSWAKREIRFSKKFDAGRKYILPILFPWLPSNTPIKQIAIVPSAASHRRLLAGCEVRTVDEVVAEIKNGISCRGIGAESAISEHYPLLRTIQLVVCGYYRLAAPL